MSDMSKIQGLTPSRPSAPAPAPPTEEYTLDRAKEGAAILGGMVQRGARAWEGFNPNNPNAKENDGITTKYELNAALKGGSEEDRYYLKQVSAKFDVIDTSRDGTLSNDELAQALFEHKTFHA